MKKTGVDGVDGIESVCMSMCMYVCGVLECLGYAWMYVFVYVHGGGGEKRHGDQL